MRLIFACAVALLTLSACNTIHGIGRDIESAGSAIGGAAEETKRKM